MDLAGEVRSEGLPAAAGEKRAAEGELAAPAAKKAARSGDGSVRKVAELLLVLAAMGRMRGGRGPTAVEAEMMAEARGKLAEVCQGFAPKDVFPRDAFGAVIEDLGLSKAKEPRLGFRSHKVSIAEKLSLSKQKMEKADEFSLHTATYSPQPMQPNVTAAAESCRASPGSRMFPPDKPSHASISSVGFPPATPSSHTSATNTTSLPYQLPSSEVRPMVSSGLPSSHLGRDSSLLALPRGERPQFRLDGRSNGSSYASQVQVKHSGDQTMVKTPTWSVQPQSASSAKLGPDNKMPSHTSVKVEGSSGVSTSKMAPQATTSKPFITQTTSGNPPNIRQHAHGSFGQASMSNSHNEIGKIVQKLLHPQLPEHPTWTPPSRDYMNRALTCQMCKITINEVDTLLVCDSCEKGYHLKCVQPHNQKLIPKGEWHCGKCLALSSGKALPPKYGRVMRNMTASKVSSNATEVQLSAEKKNRSSDDRVNLQRVMANGNTVLQSSPAVTLGNNHSHATAGSKNADIFCDRRMMDDKPPGIGLNNSMTTAGSVSLPNSTGLSVSSPIKEKLVTELKPQSSPKPETDVGSSEHSQALGNAQDNDRMLVIKCMETLAEHCHVTNIKTESSEKSRDEETTESHPNDKVGQDERGIEREILMETSGTRAQGSSSADCLHDVDWIGDVLQVLDERTYYHSCCINEVVYKVQDHALFRSNSNKLMPSRLQAMWEDNKTRSKWVIGSRCYFPGDLPEEVGRPCAPESNEVYESNHDITVMAGLIQGPCEVLPSSKFNEESQRRAHLGNGTSERLWPVYLCKWFYDESKGLFRVVSS